MRNNENNIAFYFLTKSDNNSTIKKHFYVILNKVKLKLNGDKENSY